MMVLSLLCVEGFASVVGFKELLDKSLKLVKVDTVGEDSVDAVTL